VQRPEVKGNEVSGFSWAGPNPGIRPPAGRVPHQLETLCICDIRRIILEAVGDESLTGCVATPKAAQGDRLRHGIERHPEADVVEAIDSAIRVVVMPRRRRDGSGLFDQDVFVEEPRLAGPHQRTGDHGQRAAGCRVLEFLDSLPADVVVKEPTARTLRRVVVHPLARLGHVLPDTNCERRESVLGNNASQDDKTVAAVRLDVGIADENAHALRLFTFGSLLGVLCREKRVDTHREPSRESRRGSCRKLHLGAPKTLGGGWGTGGRAR